MKRILTKITISFLLGTGVSLAMDTEEKEKNSFSGPSTNSLSPVEDKKTKQLTFYFNRGVFEKSEHWQVSLSIKEDAYQTIKVSQLYNFLFKSLKKKTPLEKKPLYIHSLWSKKGGRVLQDMSKNEYNPSSTADWLNVFLHECEFLSGYVDFNVEVAELPGKRFQELSSTYPYLLSDRGEKPLKWSDLLTSVPTDLIPLSTEKKNTHQKIPEAENKKKSEMPTIDFSNSQTKASVNPEEQKKNLPASTTTSMARNTVPFHPFLGNLTKNISELNKALYAQDAQSRRLKSEKEAQFTKIQELEAQRKDQEKTITDLKLQVNEKNVEISRARDPWKKLLEEEQAKNKTLQEDLNKQADENKKLEDQNKNMMNMISHQQNLISQLQQSQQQFLFPKVSPSQSNESSVMETESNHKKSVQETPAAKTQVPPKKRKASEREQKENSIKEKEPPKKKAKQSLKKNPIAGKPNAARTQPVQKTSSKTKYGS